MQEINATHTEIRNIKRLFDTQEHDSVDTGFCALLSFGYTPSQALTAYHLMVDLDALTDGYAMNDKTSFSYNYLGLKSQAMTSLILPLTPTKMNVCVYGESIDDAINQAKSHICQMVEVWQKKMDWIVHASGYPLQDNKYKNIELKIGMMVEYHKDLGNHHKFNMGKIVDRHRGMPVVHEIEMMADGKRFARSPSVHPVALHESMVIPYLPRLHKTGSLMC